MGSDLAIVSVQSYHEWTRQEAISRQLAYGFPADPHDLFFLEEGPWLEMRVHLRCVHPDSPLDWGWLFLTRLLDEGVYHAARGDSSGFDFEKTPLFERYPNLWKMSGPRIEKESESLVRIVEVELMKTDSPREGNREDPVGDTLTVAFFVHKKWAPNLDGYGGWESRAWGGGEYATRQDVDHKRPILAEIRPISPSLRASLKPEDGKREGHRFTAMAPRPGGGIWVATASRLYSIAPGGDGTADLVLDLAAEHRASGIHTLATTPDGSLWIGAHQALVKRHPDGHRDVFRKDESTLGKKLHAVAVGPDGQVYAGTEKGLHLLGADGTWSVVTEGLAEKSVVRLVPHRGGVVWTSGPQKLTRRNADGSLDRFLGRQGIDSCRALIALPDGGTWVSSWMGVTVHVPPGAAQATPDELAAHVAPGGLALAATGPDDALWCVTRRGYLLRLRAGEAPRVYVGKTSESPLWSPQAEVCVTPEGDLWLRSAEGDILCVTRADLASADSAPPLNADMPGRVKSSDSPGGLLAPVAFGPVKSPAAAAAPEIDLQGKTVVITGTLSKLTRDEAQRELARRGALISESVNKKTDYLIVGLRPSSKLAKAKSLGIPVLTEDVLVTAKSPAS